MYPPMAAATDTKAMASKVKTSCKVPLLYSIQYLLGVSQVRENVTVDEKGKIE